MRLLLLLFLPIIRCDLFSDVGVLCLNPLDFVLNGVQALASRQ